MLNRSEYCPQPMRFHNYHRTFGRQFMFCFSIDKDFFEMTKTFLKPGQGETKIIHSAFFSNPSESSPSIPLVSLSDTYPGAYMNGRSTFTSSQMDLSNSFMHCQLFPYGCGDALIYEYGFLL